LICIHNFSWLNLMGNSKSRKKVICQYCGCQPLKIVNANQTSREDLIKCPRCQGYVNTAKPRTRQADELNRQLQERIHRTEISFLRLGIFETSYAICDENEPSHDTILESYVYPYFQGNPIRLRAGMRFQANDLDFKVLSLFPPEGVVGSNTQIQLHTETPDSKPQFIGNDTALHQIHILPSKLTTDHPPDTLLDNYLKPYLRKDDIVLTEGEVFVYNNVQFRVMACRPSTGTIDPRIEIWNNGDSMPDIESVKILPIYETIPNRDKNMTPSQMRTKYLDAYLQGRFHYLKLHKKFEIQGVEFVVINCTPNEGLFTCQTKIENRNERGGRHMHTNAITADELSTMLMSHDEELARQLQEQENQHRPMFVIRNSNNQRLANLNPHQQEMFHNQLQTILASLQQANGAPQQNGARRQSGPGGPQGRIVPLHAIFEQLNAVRIPQETGLSTAQISMLPTKVFREPAGSPRARPMKSPDDIDDIDDADIGDAVCPPTSSSSDLKMLDEDDDQLKCRICLMRYEEGEVQRTLPCFHTFHADCVDRWLHTATTCPICRNDLATL